MIYLDNAATSFPKPKGMAEAMMEHMVSWCGNPGRSGHEMSRRTAAAIAETREELAGFIGAKDPSRILFTQNATAALNLAIHGILKPGDHVITTSMEHNSVLRPLISSGADYTIIECEKDGSLDAGKVRDAIRSNTRMIACTHASNVTGGIMPIEQLMEIRQQHNSRMTPEQVDAEGLLLLIDASQSLGHIPVNVSCMTAGPAGTAACRGSGALSDSAGHRSPDGTSGPAGGRREAASNSRPANRTAESVADYSVDLLAGPGHKGLLGPMGTGFLYVRPGLELNPIIQGGTGTFSKLLEPPLEFPESFEAGTVNAPGLIGLGYSLKKLVAMGAGPRTSIERNPVNGSFSFHHPAEFRSYQHELTRELDEALRNMTNVTVYGPADCRQRVGIISFNIDGWDSRSVASLLDNDFGIATRAGFHCAGLAHKTIGTWDTGAIRMSIGAFNSLRQIRLAADAVYRISKLPPGTDPAPRSPGCRRA